MMAEYTQVDEYMNSIRVKLPDEPLIVQRCYIIGRYDVAFIGETNQEAIAKMEAWAAENTPYRGFSMIGKHLGYYDLYVANDGKRYLHDLYAGKGKFKFVRDGIQ